jgi:thiol-disulfide isomerase/thioredoxin
MNIFNLKKSFENFSKRFLLNRAPRNGGFCRPGLLILPAVLLLLPPTAHLYAQQPAAQTPQPAQTALDPQALKVLKDFGEAWKKIDRFKTQVELIQSVQRDSGKTERSAMVTFARQKPLQFLVELKSDTPLFAVVSDGTKLYTTLSFLNQYVVEPVPADLDLLIHGPHANPLLTSQFNILLPLLADDPYPIFTKELTSASLIAADPASPGTGLRAKYSQPQYDWELELENRDNVLLIKKITQTMPVSSAPSSPKVQYNWQFKDWIVNSPLPPETFVFTTPANARQARFPGETFPAESHPLLGWPARDTAFTLMDGTKVDLAQHRGKDVVVLDFWATWCGPCRQSMPILNQIARQYRQDKQPVVFYAINLRENSSTINRYLESIKLDIPIGLDPQGVLAQKYRVESIPQTVVIDKDGVVQSVHLGLLPDMDLTLRGEINYLLAGKKLIEK